MSRGYYRGDKSKMLEDALDSNDLHIVAVEAPDDPPAEFVSLARRAAKLWSDGGWEWDDGSPQEEEFTQIMNKLAKLT